MTNFPREFYLSFGITSVVLNTCIMFFVFGQVMPLQLLLVVLGFFAVYKGASQ